jgi:4'-phosphopantetheinyl transferase
MPYLVKATKKSITPMYKLAMNQFEPKLLPLHPNQIDLWFFFEDDITSVQLQYYRDQLLSPEERARELRFHFAHSRTQFVSARALVRTVLSRYVAIAPAAWQFRAGSHGRPEIVQPEGAALGFNLSHTTGLVVLAVGGYQTLGVDVEDTMRRPAPLDVAGHSFSVAEVNALHALPQDLQAARFFHYWTLKESYIKAKGQGLSIPLSQFSMALEQAGQVAIQFSAGIEPAPAGWQFFLLQASERHVVSVCAQADVPLQLRMIKLRPFCHEENFSAQLLRQTHKDPHS